MLRRGRTTALVIALIAAFGVAALAEAAPLTVRVGWVVTPGHMAPLIEALGKREPEVFKHLGHSYVIQPLRFNGTTPQIQVQAIGDLEVASFSTSALALAITNAHLDERLVADVVGDGHPGYFSENFVVLMDGPIRSVEDLKAAASRPASSARPATQPCGRCFASTASRTAISRLSRRISPICRRCSIPRRSI